MPTQDMQGTTTASIPHAYCLVFARAGKHLPIGTPHHRPHSIGMALQCVKALPLIHIPDTHGTILAPTDQQLTIRTEVE